MSEGALPKIPAGFQESSWDQAVIRKGFVRRGYIEAKEGLHPDLRFVFTPMLPEEVDQLEDAVTRAAKAFHASSIIAKELATRIKSWSLDDPINEGSLRSLGMAMFLKLRVIVCLRQASDIDPLWTKETSEFKSIDELMGESLQPLGSD